MSGMGTGLVIAAGDITYVMKSVLDAPVLARQRKQLLGTGLLRGETGDRIHCLDGFLTTHDPFAGDAADLPHPRPAGARYPLSEAVVSIRRVSIRPWTFSMVSARPRSDGGDHAAEGGKRPEGLFDIGFQGGLIAFNGEEIVTATVNDHLADRLLREDRITGDGDPLQGNVFSNSSAAVISLASGGTRNWPITPCKPALNAASRCVPGDCPWRCRATASHRSPYGPIAGASPVTQPPNACSSAATSIAWNNSHHTDGAGTRPRSMRDRRERVTAQPPPPANDAELVMSSRQHRGERDQQQACQRITFAFRAPVVRHRCQRLPEAARLRCERIDPRIPSGRFMDRSELRSDRAATPKRGDKLQNRTALGLPWCGLALSAFSLHKSLRKLSRSLSSALPRPAVGGAAGPAHDI